MLADALIRGSKGEWGPGALESVVLLLRAGPVADTQRFSLREHDRRLLSVSQTKPGAAQKLLKPESRPMPPQVLQVQHVPPSGGQRAAGDARHQPRDPAAEAGGRGGQVRRRTCGHERLPRH